MDWVDDVDDRYTANEIRRYEAIYGHNFISPGGEASAKEFLAHVQLPPYAHVLDVGCGVGGSAFYMARTFGCQVDGIDLARETIQTGRARATELGLAEHVTFLQGDCVTYDYPRRDYALVYSRDTFLHIVDKPRLFATLRGCLAPGGTLLFTDYIVGRTPPGPEFEAYITRHGYALATLDGYLALLTDAGFDVTRAEDLTARFIATNQAELARLPQANLPPDDIAYLAKRWSQKIARAERGEQSWALFIARLRP